MSQRGKTPAPKKAHLVGQTVFGEKVVISKGGSNRKTGPHTFPGNCLNIMTKVAHNFRKTEKPPDPQLKKKGERKKPFK